MASRSGSVRTAVRLSRGRGRVRLREPDLPVRVLRQEGRELRRRHRLGLVRLGVRDGGEAAPLPPQQEQPEINSKGGKLFQASAVNKNWI